MRIEDETTLAGGHRLAVRRLLPGRHNSGAEEKAPWLVLLHEGLGSIAQWKDFPQALVEATGLPALVYERWGFGGSDRLVLPRPDDYLDREAQETLPAVLAAIGIERPLLVGHSDGATIALLYAAFFPERPLGLVSMAAHVFVEEISLAGIRQAEAAWRTGDLAARLARYHGDKTELVFRGWAETWQRPSFRDWQMLDRLPAIRCPVLALQGLDDHYGSPRQVELIVEGVCGPAEPCLLPACGHAPHLEAPAATLAAIEGFVRRCL